MAPGRAWAGPLLSVVVLLMLSLAGEGVLRWRHRVAREALAAEHGPPRCTQTAEDPRLLYRYAAGECGHNSKGYRGPEHAFEKPPGSFRIAVVGDSVAAGQYVAAGQAFPRVLERQLQRELPGDFEVVVLAREGYSTSQELVLLEEEVPHYEPDLVLWSYVLNDPAHPVFHNANGELGFYYFTPGVHLFHFLHRQLFVLRQEIRARGCPDEYHQMLHCVYRGQVEAAFARLGRFAFETGTPLVVILHPVFERGRSFSRYSLSALHRRLGGLAERHDLAVFDALEAYRPYRAEDLENAGSPGGRYDPWHPNAAGHRLVGRSLARFLIREGHVPRAEGAALGYPEARPVSGASRGPAPRTRAEPDHPAADPRR